MFSMNEPDLGWWEKEEPEGWSAEDEADMRVTAEQEDIELPAAKPVLYQTGRLFDKTPVAREDYYACIGNGLYVRTRTPRRKR